MFWGTGKSWKSPQNFFDQKSGNPVYRPKVGPIELRHSYSDFFLKALYVDIKILFITTERRQFPW